MTLSIEEVIAQFGRPRVLDSERAQFDPEHAVSHRTWLAIANFLAYHEPRNLNLIFQGVNFPEMNLISQDKLEQETFPDMIKNQITLETRLKYAYLRQTPRLYGSMTTRLQLFQHLVEAMGNLGNEKIQATANFLVGRNIRVNRDIGALKAAFLTSVKGLLKIIGNNPAEVMQKHIPDANRALNKFLDLTVVNYGADFMDVRIEYFRPEDVSREGDHYTLGTILSGLEGIAAYNLIEIKALQSPLSETDERLKEEMNAPGIKYIYQDRQNRYRYNYQKEGSVFLYRYTYHEPARFWKRVLRVCIDFSRQSFPSALTKRELNDLRQTQLLMKGEEERDTLARTELQARAEAAEKQRDVLEARRTIENQVSGVNEVLGEVAELAHHIKNLGLAQSGETISFFKYVLEHLYPDYYQQQGGERIFSEENKLKIILLEIIADQTAPELLKKAAALAETLKTAASFTLSSQTRLEEIVEKARAIMHGNMPIEIKDRSYKAVLQYVLQQIYPAHPTVKIKWNPPEPDFHWNIDDNLVKLAFLNIINNAVEASEPNGEVYITQLQKARRERTFTLIDIYQTGVLTSEIAQKLNGAEKFTTKEKGNATGAVAGYNVIVKTHHGKIEYYPLTEVGLPPYQGKIKIII